MRSTASSAWARRETLLALAAFGGASLAYVLGWFHPYDLVTAMPDLCLFRRLTGLDCPGCGMGRATALLAQGQIGASWARHPFALLGLFGLAFWSGTPVAWRERHRASLSAVSYAALFFLIARWGMVLSAR